MSSPSTSKKGTTVAILIVIIALGAVVAFNYLLKVRNDQEKGRLSMVGRVEKDIESIDHLGQPRRFDALKGKVWVVGWLYSTCPRGCAGLAVEMAKLQKEFAANPRFHLVSISLDPTYDTPATLKNWVDTHGFTPENWWFLTGDETKLIPYVRSTFGLWRSETPVKEMLSPQDKWMHPIALRLIDHKGNLRGDHLYYPNHAAYNGKYFPHDIRPDIQRLLDEAAQPTP
jgi:cytochrome oxidase Cu insertion factor (SCO1/SenC/PrrC family)